MSIAHLLFILKARWRSALVASTVVVGLVGLFTALVPTRYTASGAVVLDVKSPDPIAGVVLPGMMVSSYMATQVDVIQSERVMMRALKALHADKDAALKDNWLRRTGGRGDFESWLAEDVGKGLDAKPGKDSNVILVSYSSRNPELAAQIANAVIAAYIDTTLQLRTEPAKQFNSLFDESTKTLRERLEAAQARLSAFQQTHGIVATDEKLDTENARLSELSTQLVSLQATATESQGRQKQALTNGSQMSEVLGNTTISLLSADLARQQARLSEVSQRLGDRHPQVEELRGNIAELRRRIDAEKANIAGSIGVNNSVNQARLETLKSEVAAQRAKVLQMKSSRDEAAVMLRDVENAQRVYDAAFSRQNQSALESQATQTNVSVVKSASVPPFPSSPRWSVNAAVALVLGALIGVATALAREHRDWRLRNDDDVLEIMRQPLLGVLPNVPRSPEPGGSGRVLQGLSMRLLGRSPPLAQG